MLYLTNSIILRYFLMEKNIMQQTSALISVLKRSLKEHGVTYADLAKPLDLSEASIKRLFADESFSLKRLDMICAHIGMNMSELFTKLEQLQDYISELTEEQERTIVTDERLIVVMQLVFSDWKFEDILKKFTLSKPELINALVKLDKIGLIELLPNNRIKLLTAHNFKWRKDGPLQAFFRENVQNEFFQSDFKEHNSSLIYMNGMLSADAYKEFQKKLNEFSKDFDLLCKSDSKTPLEQRLGYGVVLAIRPWAVTFSKRYVRNTLKN